MGTYAALSAGHRQEDDVHVFDLEDFEDLEDQRDHAQRQFMMAASQLSEGELRDFVLEHIRTELVRIHRLPLDERTHAFRLLQAEWHPDKCPTIAGLATEVFQMMQQHKKKVLA